MRFFTLILTLTLFTAGAEDKKSEAIKVSFSLLKDFKLPIRDQTYAEKEELKALIKGVPKEVLELNGKRIKIAGFMVPLALDKKSKVPLFLLAPDTTSCCYGAVPNLNGFIYCSGKIGFDYKNDHPIEVTGKIITKPYYDKNEQCVLMYKMIPESVKVLKVMPKDLKENLKKASKGRAVKKEPAKNKK